MGIVSKKIDAIASLLNIMSGVSDLKFHKVSIAFIKNKNEKILLSMIEKAYVLQREVNTAKKTILPNVP